MPQLKLHLLGPPDVERDGEALHIPRRKAMALLAYLALTGRAHQRDALATFLWPESDQSSARAELRRTLSVLNRALGKGWLTADRDTAELTPGANVWLDVDAFRQKLAACRAHDHPEEEICSDCLLLLEEAVALYSDDFLVGFTLRDSAQFDEWQFFETQSLRDGLAGALERLASAYGEREDYDQAIAHARRWLSLDPLHEPAHRLLMRLYAQAGQRAAALRQYEECEGLLQEELGVGPQRDTVVLHKAVRTGALIVEGREPAAAPQIAEPPGHNLPAQVTSFIGRERELAELATLLNDRDARLTTVVGAGGMGKTRLALQSARAALEHFPAGAWWVDLAPVPDALSVARAVAAALSVQEQPDRRLSETIVASLRRRKLLLVLDNCEHVVDGAAQLVALLLSRCPDLVLLATSREPLHVPGEHLYEVPPMELTEEAETDGLLREDAVQLFHQRAAAVRSGFSLDESSLPLIAEVCRRLDGMPLAIELAAARMRALSLEDLVPRLDDRFRLLTGGSRTALPRQQTLRNAIEWSYALLSEAECALFDRLSVFAGSFSVEGAEQVCSGGDVLAEDVLGLLMFLVDKSLVTTVEAASGRTRYRLLETLRAYGRERLAIRGEADEMARRHAWFCVDLAEALEPALYTWDREMAAAVARLDADADNLAAAMRWSLASGQPEVALRIGGAVTWWLMNRPHRIQYAEWLPRAVAEAGAVAPRWRAKALCTIALHAQDDKDCYAAAQEALALAYEAKERLLIGWALFAAGHTGKGRQPRASLEDAADIGRTEGDRVLYVCASGDLAVSYAETPAERLALLEEVLPEAPRYVRMWVSSMASGASLALGKLDEAKKWSEATLSGWIDLRNNVRLAFEPLFVAQIAIMQGDYERAREGAQQAADLARQAGEMRAVTWAVLVMGELAWLRDDQDEAACRLSEGLDMARSQAWEWAAAEARMMLALVACEQGAYDRAKALCGEAQASFPAGDQTGTRLALPALARVALYRGDLARAVELYRRALEDPVRRQHRPDIVQALEYLAWALAADGQSERAARLLACAVQEREDMGIVLFPVDRPHHERAIETARTALGEDTFAAAWERGKEMGYEKAMTWALASESD